MVLGGDPTLEQSPDQIPVDRPDIQVHDQVCLDIPDEGDMDISIAEPDVPIPVLQPPPGFLHFSWPWEEWGPDGDPSLFDFSKELPGWFPWGYRGQSVDPPSLPISPIIHDSLDDSVVANVGSSRDESNTRSEANNVPKTVVEAMPLGMDLLPDVLTNSPPPDVPRSISVSPVEVVSDLPDCLTRHAGRRSPDLVRRWRLAREGPFLAERSSSSLRCFGDACSFRNMTYRPSDYASPSGEFGVPLHHPRFLEWIDVPESASMLEMGPGRWLHSLSQDQPMDAAIQLHQDVCLMTTNLDVLDQYALCLQGTASTILELGLGPRGFPSAEVAAGALEPRVRHASVQMEAMGLWRLSLDPVMIP